jgi:elongation factor 2
MYVTSYKSQLISDRETVQQPSSQVALAKSANKHNRIYMTAEPLGDDLVNDIESGKFDTRQEFKTRGRLLADKYGWDVNQARKIFAFGPTDRDPNVILDATVGIDTREIKDSVVTAFTQYVRPISVLTFKNRSCRTSCRRTITRSPSSNPGRQTPRRCHPSRTGTTFR